MAVAYGNLSVDQLRRMLDAAHANHHQQVAELKANWVADVAELKEAMARSQSQLTAELRAQKDVAASLSR